MTDTKLRLEIPLNKSKIVLMFLAALVFVIIGLWFVINPPEIKNAFWGHPAKIAILGYASLIFFGLCAFLFVRKLSDNKPGLIIDETGLTVNSSGMSGGHVLWSDIEAFSVMEVHKQRLIMLHIKNPQLYIDRQTNLLKRKTMQLNNRMYGTPLSISSNSLKVSFERLVTLLSDHLEASKK
jgi:hypothetical protein